MVKLTPEQIDYYAAQPELLIDLPDAYLKPRSLKARYHLFLGDVNEGNDKEDLFYNQDLRSHCGMLGEAWGVGGDIILFPRYYAQGWRMDHWFSNLLRDATSVKPSSHGEPIRRATSPAAGFGAAAKRIGGI